MEFINVTIISLIKDSSRSLNLTGKSIIDQKINFSVEWIIIDGSNNNFIKSNLKLINIFKKKDNKHLKIIHKNMNDLKIFGIYTSMNYGLKIAKGECLIFLNCGDIFFNRDSLNIMYNNLKAIKNEKSFLFGQARIFYSEDLFWEFPGKRVTNIKRWIKKFDPNHQSMLVTSKLAKKYTFNENCRVIADGLWKRKIIQNAESFIYLKTPVITFYLDGVSNMKPPLKIGIEQIKNKEVSLLRKIIIIFKLLLPNKIYNFYPYFQKYKSLLIDFIF